jgi:hypothetical protein
MTSPGLRSSQRPWFARPESRTVVTIESDIWCITKNAEALGDDADDDLVPLLHPPTITDTLNESVRDALSMGRCGRAVASCGHA